MAEVDIPLPVQVEVARHNWRADLLRVDAGERTRLVGDDESPVADALRSEGDKKVSEADLHEAHGALMAEFAAAKAASKAAPTDQRLYKKYKDITQELAEMRTLWRQIGEALNTRGILTVDNFPEPTDEEVLASHGGTA